MVYHNCLLITHVLPVPCPPSEQSGWFAVSLQQRHTLLQGHCKPTISRRWKVMTGKRRPRGLYTICWTLNPSQVESISYGKIWSPILVWCHSCLKMPTQQSYSTMSWICQRSCGTSESKLDSCADNGPAALCNSKRDTVAVAWLIQ